MVWLHTIQSFLAMLHVPDWQINKRLQVATLVILSIADVDAICTHKTCNGTAVHMPNTLAVTQTGFPGLIAVSCLTWAHGS